MSALLRSIEKKLNQALEIQSLEVLNESNHHSGHAGDNGSGETHFRIRIQSSDLGSLNRVQQHRAINKILAEELAGPIHALAIEIITE